MVKPNMLLIRELKIMLFGPGVKHHRDCGLKNKVSPSLCYIYFSWVPFSRRIGSGVVNPRDGCYYKYIKSSIELSWPTYMAPIRVDIDQKCYLQPYIQKFSFGNALKGYKKSLLTETVLPKMNEYKRPKFEICSTIYVETKITTQTPKSFFSCP